MTLGAFDGTERSVRAIRIALSTYLRNHIRITEMAAGLQRYSAQHGAELKIAPFTISRDQMTRFVNGQLQRPQIEGFMRTAWAWLRDHHEAELRKAWEDASGFDLDQLHPLLGSVSRFLHGEEAPPVHYLDNIQGTFTAYRRSFLHPETELMAMALTCGLEDDPSGFTMEISYPYLRKDRREHVRGVMIPFRRGSILFFGHLIEKQAAFLFMLSEFTHSGGRKQWITEAKGAILVGGTANEVSAWPIVAFYDPNPTAETIAIDALDPGIARAVLPVMGRGYIARR